MLVKFLKKEAEKLNTISNDVIDFFTKADLENKEDLDALLKYEY